MRSSPKCSLRANQHSCRTHSQQRGRREKREYDWQLKSGSNAHLTQLQSHQSSIQKRCWCPSSRSSQRRKRFLLFLSFASLSQLNLNWDAWQSMHPCVSQRQASGYNDDTNSCPSLALKILSIPSPIPRLLEHLSPLWTRYSCHSIF